MSNGAEKIALEVAEAEFTRFGDLMDLDLDPLDMDEEDKKGFEQQKKRVISSIQNGSLIINENGEPIFTPTVKEGANPLTFHEPTGASLMAMDHKKRTEDVGKLYATMADMTGSSTGIFSKMKMRDLKVCMAITTLFLG